MYVRGSLEESCCLAYNHFQQVSGQNPHTHEAAIVKLFTMEVKKGRVHTWRASLVPLLWQYLMASIMCILSMSALEALEQDSYCLYLITHSHAHKLYPLHWDSRTMLVSDSPSLHCLFIMSLDMVISKSNHGCNPFVISIPILTQYYTSWLFYKYSFSHVWPNNQTIAERSLHIFNVLTKFPCMQNSGKENM